MTLVAGIDSSTQSCKVVVRDLETGALQRRGAAAHPPGTEVNPYEWRHALDRAVAAAGGLDDVAAVAVGGQQHGMVCLDETGDVVRPALLWNDTRSAQDAADLVDELGGAEAWARAVGSVPVAAFTITKLRWLARHEPDNAARMETVCLPHDWVSQQLQGGSGLTGLSTDRSDASGTGYFSAASGTYRVDLLVKAFGRKLHTPPVLGPNDVAGCTASGALVGPGAGDNAAAALGVGARPGDVLVSVGTSGVISAVSERPTTDPTGMVAGFADATGRFLPLACTLNGAPVLASVARMLGVDLRELSRLALTAPPGCDGLTLVPYFAGERTPNRPDATGALLGLTTLNSAPAYVARAAVEGLLCGLADGFEALRGQGIPVERVLLVGGGANSEALRRIAPAVFGVPVLVPEPREYVADGAARQAAWILTGELPSVWDTTTQRYQADPTPFVLERYHDWLTRLDRAPAD